jgi:hypothetical protein
LPPWKIENECFNTLKNQGYQMNHNFGHGEQNLTHNMYLSTLLAFFLHQIVALRILMKLISNAGQSLAQSGICGNASGRSFACLSSRIGICCWLGA